MSVLGTNPTSVAIPVSLRLRITKSRITPAPLRFQSLLTMTVLHDVTRLDKLTGSLLLSQSNGIGKGG